MGEKEKNGEKELKLFTKSKHKNLKRKMLKDHER
jgi:hypothetical protein